MYLYQPISNILSRTDYNYILPVFLQFSLVKKRRKKEEKLNVKGKAKVGLHGDQPTNQPASQVFAYIHTSSPSAYLFGACGRARARSPTYVPSSPSGEGSSLRTRLDAPSERESAINAWHWHRSSW